MMFVVELVDDELDIEPIHRLLDLPPDVDLRARLADAFDDHRPSAPNSADDDRRARRRAWRRARARPRRPRRPRARGPAPRRSRASALADEHPAVAATDAAVVEALVVPRLPEATWRYRHDAQAVAALVDKGAASAAILCSPVSVAQTRAAAIDRARMPQKTTFFTPEAPVGDGVPQRCD